MLDTTKKKNKNNSKDLADDSVKIEMNLLFLRKLSQTLLKD